MEQYLDKGTPPEQIGFVTFTRKASEEAVDRACAKFNFSRSQFPYFRTIHSLVFRQLGLRSSEIFEGSKLREFASWIGIKLSGRWSEDGLFQGFEVGDRILFLENLARVKGKSLDSLYKELGEDIPYSELDRVVRGLKTFKKVNGLYDFTDILQMYIANGRKPKLDLLLCDEVQDQSHLQWLVVERLALGVNKVVLAGDDDQSIYQWAGADIQRVVSQQGDVTVLGQSYRVPPEIQKLAFNIINRVKNRRPKEWQPRPDSGIVERVTSLNKIDLSGPDILILARNTYLLNDVVEPELRRAGIIYSRNGNPSVKEGITRAIMDWEAIRNGGELPIHSVLNMYEYISTGTGVKRGFKKLPGLENQEFLKIKDLIDNGGLLIDPRSGWIEALDRISVQDKAYIIAARKRGEKILGKPRVRISTIHTAKGGEADHVVLLKEMARKTYKELELDPDAEARVWYVAVTRTRTKLTIVETSNGREVPFL